MLFLRPSRVSRRRLFILTTTLLFASAAIGQVPTITGFNPTSGPVGTQVTITGTNFNSTPANNTVHFGVGKASVLSASSTQLVVTVPGTATLQPISVTVNNKSAYSRLSFVTS